MHDDDEVERPRKEYPLSTRKMSKTPSWVMLGFVLGAVTVWSLVGHLERSRPVATAAVTEDREETRAKLVAAATPREPRPLSEIDAVFEQWKQYVVWEYDLTEVALWNEKTRAYSDCYEVFRYAGRYFFRPIPELTRRVIRRGKEIPECPLLFTETEEQYQEWRQHGRNERPLGDYRPLSAFPGATQPQAVKSPEAPRIMPQVPPKFEDLAPFTPPGVSPGATANGAKGTEKRTEKK